MYFEIVLSLIAGLVLFLFSIKSLSEEIKEAISEKINNGIQKFTSTTLSSLIVGILATAILDSSSAVIIITIILINSKVLQFKQAMGIVLGANIGTTFNSQIIALQIGNYSAILLLIGFALYFIARSKKLIIIGKIVFYFGLLFFGMYTMEHAVEPLKDLANFSAWIKNTEQPLFGVFVGAIATLITQSSSATVGMAIILAKKGMLALGGGVAIMLGAELGTCSDTLLATIKGSRQALKTGIFHISFNVLSIILGLLFFDSFLELVNYVSHGKTIEHAIANAHMLFNITGVLIFVWTLPVFEKILNKILPDAKPS